MRIDSAGNLGLGVTPSAWGSSFKAIQVNLATLAAFGNNSNNLGYNNYFDGTDTRYITSNFSSVYQQTSGNHIWFGAASGTAGNVISFTERMRIDSSGNVGIGTTTAGSKLTVAGASSIYNSTNANTGSGYVLSITGNSNKSTAADNVNFAIFTNDALASNPLHLGVGLIGNATPANGYAYLQASQYGTGNFNNIALNPSGGNVGIGTSSPTAKLDVSSSSAGVTAGDFVVDTANKTVFVGRQSSTDGDNSNFIVKNRAGIEVMKVDASTQTVKTRLTISVGDATPASTGAGITFPATQSASSDANTLDDYEEGDFTPSITQGNTYSVRVGRYTKIGRVVNFYLNIECTITTGGGVQMSVSGLPFTVLNTSNLFFPCSVFAHTGWFVTSSTAIQAQIAPNTTEIYMFGFQNSTGQNYLVPTTSTCGGTVFIELAGSYQTT
jgi:hypothetical protein